MKKINILFLSLLLVSCSGENNSSLSSSSNSNVSISNTSSSKDDTSSKESTTSSTIVSSSNDNDLPPISYVKVFAPVEFTHIYAWVNESSGVKELCSSWPGTYLNEYDDEWKTYDFIGYTEVNLIFFIALILA